MFLDRENPCLWNLSLFHHRCWPYLLSFVQLNCYILYTNPNSPDMYYCIFLLALLHKALQVESTPKSWAVYRWMFDINIKDERSAITDNFFRLPTEMPFGASPDPEIEVAKTSFPLLGQWSYWTWTSLSISGSRKSRSAPYPQKRIFIWRDICHGKKKTFKAGKWCRLRSGSCQPRERLAPAFCQ